MIIVLITIYYCLSIVFFKRLAPPLTPLQRKNKMTLQMRETTLLKPKVVVNPARVENREHVKPDVNVERGLVSIESVKNIYYEICILYTRSLLPSRPKPTFTTCCRR